MFKVKSKRSGNVYKVYAVDKGHFFIFRSGNTKWGRTGWYWVKCTDYVPLEESDG